MEKSPLETRGFSFARERVRSVEKHSQEGSVELQTLGSPRFPVESCGSGQVHVVLFTENHIDGAGESCEVGNPGTLLMNKMCSR